MPWVDNCVIELKAFHFKRFHLLSSDRGRWPHLCMFIAHNNCISSRHYVRHQLC